MIMYIEYLVRQVKIGAYLFGSFFAFYHSYAAQIPKLTMTNHNKLTIGCFCQNIHGIRVTMQPPWQVFAWQQNQ